MYAQTQEENLVKYWKYRDKLRNKFIVINENVEHFGVNIPAAYIDYNNARISWGDANSNMSHYLSVLATELWLLKQNYQDYSTTLKELYYAMLAMERLDTYSEYSIRYKENIGYWFENIWIRGYIDKNNDINGFHIRDDVSQAFWDTYKNHFDVPRFISIFQGDNDRENMEEISQDNIYHNLEGLALVAKLVGTESISNIPVNFVNTIIPDRLKRMGIQNGTNIDFSLWAKDFVKRYITLMQNETTISVAGCATHWYLRNPVTNKLVREGNGDDLDMGTFYHYGVIKTGEAITEEDLRIYNGLVNPPEYIYDGLFRRHSIEVNLKERSVEYIIDNLFKKVFQYITFDDYKLRSLSCNGNVIGSETFEVLREHRDNYNPFNTGVFPIYEHFPLMYLTLHDQNNKLMQVNGNIFNEDKIIYENLLNTAPLCGPTSYGQYEWSSTSRCVWPENLGKNTSKNIEYSGLDYMMLHNLYYITFRSEDYKILNIGNLSPYRTISADAGIIHAYSSIVGNNIKYYAKNRIKLSPGFSVSQGKTFEAKIKIRPNNYIGFMYKELQENECNPQITQNSNVKTEQLLQPIFLEPICNEYSIQKENNIKIFDSTSITIYPNPNNGLFKINVLESNFPIEYQILTLHGIKVHQAIAYSYFEYINISHLPKGIYILQLNINNTVQNIKISII